MRTCNVFPLAIGLAFAISACKGEEALPTGAPGTQPGVAGPAAAPPAAANLWCQPGPCACADGKRIAEEKGKPQNCKLAQDATVQGVLVKGGQYSTTYFDKDGVLSGFDLVQPHAFGAIECSGANVKLFAPDRVKSCYVKKPHVVDGIQCEGSITINEDGTVHRCQMSAAAKFENLEVPAKSWITFYDGTKLVDRFEIPSGDLAVDGHRCKGYVNYMHKNGKLRKCELAAEETIEGKKYKVGDSVCFGEAGQVVDCSTMTFVSM